jgi:hypothetical protein
MIDDDYRMRMERLVDWLIGILVLIFMVSMIVWVLRMWHG